MLQERNREMKELQRKMPDTYEPKARLLNCLALCCRAETKKMSKSRGEHEARKEN